VLDATTRLNECLRIVERAERLQPTAIVFTKLDVASNYGFIFDVIRQSKLPLLGVSLSPSFKTPFKSFEPISLAQFILKGKE
jgi:flagellar biosynthesis GTPase FlhF